MQKAQHESSSPDSPGQDPGPGSQAGTGQAHEPVNDEPSREGTDSAVPAHREYDRSGLYPSDGKAFRIWALLGWLAAVIVVLAGISALLNILLLD